MDKWLNHPTAMKLVALALGILLWAVVHFPEANNMSATPPSQLQTKTISDVKVQYYGLDERSFVLQKIEPKTVKMVVRGTKSDLLKLGAEDYKVQVDLSTVTAGEHTLNLWANLPRGIDVVSLSPTSVTVFVEELQTKEFEAKVTVTGTPAQGYKAGTPILSPTNRVHVTLPESQMSRVDHVGASVSVEGQSKNIKNKSVKLQAFDKNGNVIEGAQIDPAVLEVEVPITNPFKTVPLQFKLVGSLPSGLSISRFRPKTEQVTIYGPQVELDKIEFIEADLKLDDLTKSKEVTIPLTAPPNIMAISPTEVTVSVEVVLSQTRTLQGLPVSIEGLADGLDVKITDPSTGVVDITLKGAPAMLDSLQPGDVDVVADLSGRGPGVHTVPLVVNTPRFIDQAGGNVSVTVEITDPKAATAPPREPSAEQGGGSLDSGAEDGTNQNTESPPPDAEPVVGE
ncbi:CdaR family protein [Cohnella sp.]|uniref:CdaR family protein n=1 Tax=Cohnella sp. TaxID=1883426 RepID=UPI002580D6CA|nr:CdaR family protein [Cohnella sp.]